MNYLLWPVGARPDAQPLYELHRPEIEMEAGGIALLVGSFRVPSHPEVFEGGWMPHGEFALCVDAGGSQYIAAPWVEQRERIAA